MQQQPPQRLPPGSRPPPPPPPPPGANGGGAAPQQQNGTGQQQGQPYSIPPSHPSHPQHQAWLHQQQLQAQAQAQAQAQPGGPPQHYHPQQQGGGGPPPIRIQTSLPPHPSPSSATATAPPRPQHQLPNGAAGHAPQPQPQRPPLPPSYNSADPRGGPPVPLPPMPPGYRPAPPSGAGVVPRPMGAGGVQGAVRNDLALAASLAAQGHGPLTATATPVGPGLSKLTAFNEALSIAFEQPSPLPSLRAVVASYFTETAVLKYGLFDPGAGLNKVFEIPISSLPRFLHIHTLQRILSHTLSPSFIREFSLSCPDPTRPPSPSPPRGVHVGYLLRADEATWHSRFEDGSKVELGGVLTVHFVVVAPSSSSPSSPLDGAGAGGGGAGLRIESMEFEARGHDEFVSREAVVRERVVRWFDEGGFSGLGSLGSASGSGSGEEAAGGQEGSPKQGGGGGGKKFAGALTRRRSAGGASASSATTDPPATPTDPTKGHKLPIGSGERWSREERMKGLGSVEGIRELRGGVGRVGSFGITEMGMRCLEIAESVAQLHELIGFSLETGLGPLQSLTRYSTSVSSLPPAPPSNPFPPTNAPQTAPIASTSQNPQTNPFYASSTVPPPPTGPGAGGEGARPESRGGGGGVPPSPGGAGAGKRKAVGPPGGTGGGGPPRTPTPGLGQQQQQEGGGGGECYEQNGAGGGGTPGSPNKVARGNGGAPAAGAGAQQGAAQAQGRGARNRRG